MNSTKEAVGDRFSEVLHKLKEARLLKNQGSVAVDTGYTVATISEIKAGRMEPPEKVMQHLQKKYNVNPDFIFLGRGPMFGKAEEVEARQEETDNGHLSEPLQRSYLVESVKNLSETEKINARSIERLITLLEHKVNPAPSNKNSPTLLDPGVSKGSEMARRATSGKIKKS